MLLTKLKAKKAEIARLREERGATDPILIIAGIAITLILLVGGSFAISGFIGNANNLNAKGDLDRVATAQAAFLAQNDKYGALSVGPSVAVQNTELADSSIGFTPTAGNNVKVRTSPTGWVAVTKSASGAAFVRSSQSSDIVEVPGTVGPTNVVYGPWAEDSRNHYLNAGAGSSVNMGWYSGVVGGFATHSVDAPWSESGKAARYTWNTVSSSASNNGGSRAALTNSYTPFLGQRMTLVFKVYSDQPYSMTAPGIVQNSDGLNIELFGRSGTIGLQPGGTVQTRYVTFTASGEISGSNVRLAQNIGDLVPGQAVEVTDFDLYLGDYDPNREWFSGSKAATSPQVRHSWSGTAHNSVSVKETRAIVSQGPDAWNPGSQPSSLSLPSGITWEHVSTDLLEVSS